MTRSSPAHARHMQRLRSQRHVRSNNFRQTFIARQQVQDVESYYAGPMDKLCPHCQALCFKKESFNCCHNGKIHQPPLFSYPDELKELLTSGDAASKNFLEFIRQYNSAFAFASMSANIHQFSARGPSVSGYMDKYTIEQVIFIHQKENKQNMGKYIFLKVGKHLMCICKTSTMFNVQRKPWHSFKEL